MGHLPGDSSSSGSQPTEACLLDSSGSIPALPCSRARPSETCQSSSAFGEALLRPLQRPHWEGEGQQSTEAQLPCECSACVPKRQRRGVKWSPSAFGSRAPPAPPPLLPHICPLRPHTSLADGFYLKALAGCAANGRALSRLPPSPWSPCADVGARHRLL